MYIWYLTSQFITRILFTFNPVNDLIIGFSEFREKQESAWQREQERKRAEAERLELAKKGLTETPLVLREAGNQTR